MKKVLLLLLIGLSSQLIAQQSSISGVVAVFNSAFETGTRQYVPNAQVEDDFKKATATTTGVDGRFKLVFVGIKDNEKVSFNVKKERMEIVNTEALYAVAGQKEQAAIFMSPEGKLAENKLKYYNINREAAEKALTTKLKTIGSEILKLKQNETANAGQIVRLQREYNSLQKQYEKIDQSAREMAERYAKINLDDQTKEYQSAFRYFQKGQLEEALKILNQVDLEKTGNAIVQEQERQRKMDKEWFERDSIKNEKKRQITEGLSFKAQLHETQFEFVKVEETYQLLLKLDSTNINALWPFADFLADQQEHLRSIKLYQKILNLTRTPSERCVALNTMAGIHNFLRNDAEASECIKEALKISEPLAAQNPDLYAKNLAMNLNTLASIYQSKAKFKEAEEFFKKSLKIYKSLAEKKPETYLSDVGNGLGQLGIFYITSGRLQEAEVVLSELPELIARLNAINPSEFSFKFNSLFSDTTLNTGQKYKDFLSYMSELASQNPNANMPWLGYSHIMESDIHIGNKQWEDAIRSISEAIGIYRKLAKEKPESFLPLLAQNLIKLGDLEKMLYKVREAHKAFKEASSLFRELSSQKPDVYLSQLAYVQYCLGHSFHAIYEIDNAEKAFLEALDIYKKLTDKNPTSYSLYLANTYSDLAVLYQNKFENEKAELLFIKTLDLYKQLEQKQGLKPKLPQAIVLNNLGLNYQRKGDNKAAENAYRESLTLHQQVEDENPGSNLLNLAICKSNLGYVCIFEQKKEEAEKHLTQALELYKQLEKKNGDRFAFNKAFTLNVLGNFYVQKKQLERGLPYLEESVKIIEKLYQNGNTQLRNQLASELGNLSWWELFARQFDKAEGYGLRCVSLDNIQIWAWTNIGHARFLNGKIEDAKNAWLHLKGIKDNAGKDFKVILQEDWTAIEKAGIVQIDTFEPARKWLTETW